MEHTKITPARPLRKTKGQKTLDYIKRFWPLYAMLLPLVVYLAIFQLLSHDGIAARF